MLDFIVSDQKCAYVQTLDHLPYIPTGVTSSSGIFLYLSELAVS